jgi:Type I restriction enzyme R protein N terminus (HSDR_N)
MDDPLYPFDRTSEADVREEILAPMIRSLGYRTGTENDIIREQSLRYPKSFLGTKNPLKDPDLRGRADYILEANRTVRWVLEAKAPGVEVDQDAVEQAWTYANHPEVRAVYFVLCNGRELSVFRTHSGPQVPPLMTLAYSEFESKFNVLRSLLSPDSVKRDFPSEALSNEGSLAPGLRSFARITCGLISYSYCSINDPMLAQLQVAIVGGSVEPSDDGTLIVFAQTQSMLKSYQLLNEKFGLDKFEMKSKVRTLSTNPTTPDQFEYERRILIPAGEQLLNFKSGRQNRLSFNLSGGVKAFASGSLQGSRFGGAFTSILDFDSNAVQMPKITVAGQFYVDLS